MEFHVGWGNDYITGSTAVNDGNWHHLAVVWDYSEAQITVGKIYVDGQEIHHHIATEQIILITWVTHSN